MLLRTIRVKLPPGFHGYPGPPGSQRCESSLLPLRSLCFQPFAKASFLLGVPGRYCRRRPQRTPHEAERFFRILFSKWCSSGDAAEVITCDGFGALAWHAYDQHEVGTRGQVLAHRTRLGKTPISKPLQGTQSLRLHSPELCTIEPFLDICI